MKIKVLIIFLALGYAKASLGQVLIGPSAGINYSWISFDDKDNKDLYSVRPIPGFHAGFNLSFRVRKKFFLHSSLIYSQKGKIITGKSDTDLRNQVTYNYIELPILYTVEFKMHLKGNKEYKIYLGAGPNLSYWLGGKGTFYNSELREAFEDPRNYKIAFHKSLEDVNNKQMGIEQANRMQLGLNLSAGFVFEPIQNKEVMLTFRYELGHSFLSRTGSGTFSHVTSYQDNLQVRNQGFRISLAYLFDLRTDQRKRGKSTFDKKKSRL